MKLRTLTLLAVLCLIIGAGSLLAQDVDKIKFPPLNPIDIPDVETITLDNGIKLYLLEDHSLPLFRVSMRVNGGSYLVPPDKIGLADLCGEVMRTGGTKKWTGDEIDEMLEGIGGRVSTSIGLVSSSGNVNVLSDYSDLGLEVLADILRNPIFDEDKIDLAKVQIKSGISRRNDDVAGIARREYNKLIYGEGTPYASQEEYETVDAVTRDDLIAFEKLIYRPQHIQMAIWGDFDRDQLVTKIKELFGDWNTEAVDLPPLPEVEYNYRSKVYLVDKPDARQAYIRMGHIGGLVTDTNYAARIVMNSILGGSFGSRLTDNVRTRLGLAYTTYGVYGANFSYPGTFFAHASTGNGNVIKAAKEMMVQIKSMLTDQPTKEEMQKGVDGYLNSFVFNFDTKGEVVNRLMNYDFFGVPRDFLQQTKSEIEQMTPERVMEAAQTSIKPDQMVVLVVGNSAEFDAPLTELGLGEPESIDISIPSPAPKIEMVVNDATLEQGKALLDKVVEAHGGRENIDAVTSAKLVGTTTIMTPQGNLPISFVELDQYPYYVAGEMNFMGRVIRNITGPNGGWMTGRDGRLADKVEGQLAEERAERDRDLINILRGGDSYPYRPVYLGTETVEGTKLELLALVDVDENPLCHLKVNADNFQIYGETYDGVTPLGQGFVEDIFSDYQDVNGVLVPQKTAKKLNGEQVSETVLTSFEINPEIPADAFEKPM